MHLNKRQNCFIGFFQGYSWHGFKPISTDMAAGCMSSSPAYIARVLNSDFFIKLLLISLQEAASYPWWHQAPLWLLTRLKNDTHWNSNRIRLGRLLCWLLISTWSGCNTGLARRNRHRKEWKTMTGPIGLGLLCIKLAAFFFTVSITNTKTTCNPYASIYRSFFLRQLTAIACCWVRQRHYTLKTWCGQSRSLDRGP